MQPVARRDPLEARAAQTVASRWPAPPGSGYNPGWRLPAC
jgi:hypothetical protein